eukprot:Pompholyxophrys_sp_v1_NODE_11_length_5290_cov_18.520778.p5 type:complete len:143 gc:universal NODE_11_length_5290_cov_18.520778:4240-4668(+)
MDSSYFALIEKFVVVAYDKGSDSNSVNETRQRLFCQENRDIERIPPTQAALFQHTLRAIYQAGVWVRSDLAESKLSSPDEWGWCLIDGKWSPVWSNEFDMSQASGAFIKCGCKTTDGCKKKQCKCKKHQLSCTELCKCKCLL